MKTERIQLDQALQFLFQISDRMTVNLINGLFNRQFDPAKVELHREDVRNVVEHEDGFKELRVDCLITITSADQKHTFHIEFQLKENPHMTNRMVEYGVTRALKNLKTIAVKGKPISKLPFPIQRVLYIEQDDKIPDHLLVRVNTPDEQIIYYSIPTTKYWNYSLSELVDQKLYALIPLYIFRLRTGLNRIKQSQKPPAEKERLTEKELLKLEFIVQQVITELRKLLDEEIINLEELEQLLGVLNYLTDHLYKKFDPSQKIIIRKVKTMFQSLVDPIKVKKAKEEGKLEGKLEGLLQTSKKLHGIGMDQDTILQVTGLTREQLEQVISDEQ